MIKPRDSQKNAVYSWERAVEKKFKLNHSLSLDECQQLINRIWAKHSRQPPPIVKDGRARRSACYEDWGHCIKLPVPQRRPMVVLHELAHALLRRQWKEPGHGKCFARIVLDLYCKEFSIPLAEIKRLAIYQRPRRVRFALLKNVNQILKLV